MMMVVVMLIVVTAMIRVSEMMTSVPILLLVTVLPSPDGQSLTVRASIYFTEISIPMWSLHL